MTKPRQQRPRHYLTDDLNWDGLLAELRAGVLLTALRDRSDLPSYHLFVKRLAADPDFAAVARPLLRNRPHPTPEAYQIALDGLKAGLPLKAVLGGKLQPNRQQWRLWKARHPDFAAEVEQAHRANGSTFPVSKAHWERILIIAQECESFAEVVERIAPSPSGDALANKLRRDPAYAARYPARCRQPARVVYTDDAIEAVVRAVEQGARLGDLEKQPGMPSRQAVMDRAKARPDLSARLAPLIAVPKYVAPDIIKAIDVLGQGVPAQQLIRLGLPHVNTIRRWRSMNPDIASAYSVAATKLPGGPGRAYQDAEFRRALSLLQEGRPSRELQAHGLPCRVTLNSYAKRHPEFAERLQGLRICRGLAEAGRDNGFARALSQNEIFAAVDRVLGRCLDPHVREEVRSEMILAVLDGYLGTDEITPQTAREFVTDYHREAGTWASRSIDAPMFSDSQRTLHDLVGG